jgi:hypothetical protein
VTEVGAACLLTLGLVLGWRVADEALGSSSSCDDGVGTIRPKEVERETGRYIIGVVINVELYDAAETGASDVERDRPAGRGLARTPGT